MHSTATLFLIGFAAAVLVHAADAKTAKPHFDCTTAAACIALAPRYRLQYGGISPKAQALAEHIQTFGKPAIKPLIDALSSHNPVIRNFAGYTLRRMPGLGARQVKPILDAALKEDQGGWLPPALAHIGTPEAIKGLVTLLRKYPELDNQIEYAFTILGKRAVPALVSQLRCKSECSDKLMGAAGGILLKLGSAKKTAVRPLTRIALDEAYPLSVRTTAISTLGGMGAAALSVQPKLLDEWQNTDGKMHKALTGALFHIGGPGLTSVYDQALPMPPDANIVELDQTRAFYDPVGYERLLVTLAEMGERAASAGPAVIRLLQAPSADVRASAAVALGFIGDPSAGPDLQNMLGSHDWLIVMSASRSLGRLRYAPAYDDLGRIAKSYWYPPVRKAAERALQSINGKYTYKSAALSGNIGRLSEFALGGVDVLPKACATISQFPRVDGSEKRIYADKDKKAISRFKYPKELHGIDKDGAEREITRVYTPDVAVRGPGGWLLGANRGEFGGELMWHPDGGPDTTLINDNIEDIYRASSHRYIATAGLSFLLTDSGRVYLLNYRDGSWKIHGWKRLPGAPESSWRLKSGKIMVNTTGGSVIVDKDGNMQMADCHSHGEAQK